MENASKALLIAASVLIVILLIAMGVKIFNSTSPSVDQVDTTLQSTDKTMFNNKFLAYSGIQNGSQVKSLANLIIAHNANNSKKVTFNGKTTANEILATISNVDSLKKYTVSIVSYKDGYIEKITFSE